MLDKSFEVGLFTSILFFVKIISRLNIEDQLIRRQALLALILRMLQTN